jgi:hypothetical protein
MTAPCWTVAYREHRQLRRLVINIYMIPALQGRLMSIADRLEHKRMNWPSVMLSIIQLQWLALVHSDGT